MTARQKNWMTFGIVWGIILTICGILVLVGYIFYDREIIHIKPELYDETKFEYALYAASNKENDSIEEYVYGDQCTFIFSRYANKQEDYHEDNGMLFNALLTLKPKEEWRINSKNDKNFDACLTYWIMLNENNEFFIRLDKSYKRIEIGRIYSIDLNDDQYYRYYSIQEEEGKKLFSTAKEIVAS